LHSLPQYLHLAAAAEEVAPDALCPLTSSTKLYTYMNWISLTDEEQLHQIKANSITKPQVIFKHSTRCSVSSMAKSRLERSVQPDEVDFYFLDLIKYRPLSNMIARDFDVYHESPQILLIKNGECVYDESHSGIAMEMIVEQSLVA